MTRVEIVPDNDADADPRIPKSVLDQLGPDIIMVSNVGHMMYVRASNWERIKHRFADTTADGEKVGR